MNIRLTLFLINTHTAVLAFVLISLHIVCTLTKLIIRLGWLMTFHFYIWCCVCCLVIDAIGQRFAWFAQSYQTLGKKGNVNSCVTWFTRMLVLVLDTLGSLWQGWMFIGHVFPRSSLFSWRVFSDWCTSFRKKKNPHSTQWPSFEGTASHHSPIWPFSEETVSYCFHVWTVLNETNGTLWHLLQSFGKKHFVVKFTWSGHICTLWCVMKRMRICPETVLPSIFTLFSQKCFYSATNRFFFFFFFLSFSRLAVVSRFFSVFNTHIHARPYKCIKAYECHAQKRCF